MTGERTFRLLGRRDRVVKIGEVRLSLTEVERVIKEKMGLVVRAFAIRKSHRLVVGCVINEINSTNWHGQCPKRSTVMQMLEGSLDPLAMPRVWRSVKDWPVNCQGKVESEVLLELFNV